MLLYVVLSYPPHFVDFVPINCRAGVAELPTTAGFNLNKNDFLMP
jgi:hypothetical protein